VLLANTHQQQPPDCIFKVPAACKQLLCAANKQQSSMHKLQGSYLISKTLQHILKHILWADSSASVIRQCVPPQTKQSCRDLL
jgi:hypothetical protein